MTRTPARQFVTMQPLCRKLLANLDKTYASYVAIRRR